MAALRENLPASRRSRCILQRMSSYRLYLDSKPSEHVVRGTSPAKALRELVVGPPASSWPSQDGRYGRLADGRSCSALTMPWSVTQHSDARTTRL